MAEYLVFHLHGAMAAWGDIAVGEARPTAAHPGKSVIVGLIGAVLGVRRDDEAAQAALARAYGMGVRLYRAGTLLRDYHTVQVSPARRRQSFATRREELAAERLNTLLSARDYRCDAVYAVAVWAAGGAPPHSLEDVAAAQRRPVFVPYLGRKSCPPGLPLLPAHGGVHEAGSLHEAFEQGRQELLNALSGSELAAGIRNALAEARPRPTYWEGSMPAPGLAAVHRFARRDQPLNRLRSRTTLARERPTNRPVCSSDSPCSAGKRTAWACRKSRASLATFTACSAASTSAAVSFGFRAMASPLLLVKGSCTEATINAS